MSSSFLSRKQHQELLKTHGQVISQPRSPELTLTFCFLKPPFNEEQQLFIRDCLYSYAQKQTGLLHITVSAHCARARATMAAWTSILGGNPILCYNHPKTKAFHYGMLDVKGQEEPYVIPQEMEGYVGAILGLSSHHSARPYARKWAMPRMPGSFFGYSPIVAGAMYNAPVSTNGDGQTIALIELGGGYYDADIQAYFPYIGVPTPTVNWVSVDGAANDPTGPSSDANGEVALDIQVAGGVAPGSKIVVYFAPNTEQGFYDAIEAAMNDGTHNPKLMSISWGAPESNWSPSAMQAMNTLMGLCSSEKNISIFVSAGDNGSTDGVSDGKQHVDFPASAPNVTGVGGTTLETVDYKTISSETVWPQTGGGVSAEFKIPQYQSSYFGPQSGITARSVPDVSSCADPSTGFLVRVNGQWLMYGGTSCGSPLWAGMMARINAVNQNKSGQGLLNSFIYSAAGQKQFRDITSGSNGAYSAKSGYDNCTGFGSPNGTLLAQFLKSLKSSESSEKQEPVNKKQKVSS